jgi:hypothetical protein
MHFNQEGSVIWADAKTLLVRAHRYPLFYSGFLCLYAFFFIGGVRENMGLQIWLAESWF